MWAQEDAGFSKFLLSVGDGRERSTADGLIEIPEEMVIKGDEYQTPEKSIIDTIYGELKRKGQCSHYLTQHANKRIYGYA